MRERYCACLLIGAKSGQAVLEPRTYTKEEQLAQSLHSSLSVSLVPASLLAIRGMAGNSM